MLTKGGGVKATVAALRKTQRLRKPASKQNKHIGSDLDTWLAEEGLLEKVVATAKKRVAKSQLRKRAKTEKSRNIGEEIVQGIRDIKAGKIGRRFTVETYAKVSRHKG